MLNGWYKSNNVTTPSLYQFTNDSLEVTISKVIQTGIYAGFHYVNNLWVAYPDQPSMNAVWVAEFNNAAPLPGSAVVKK